MSKLGQRQTGGKPKAQASSRVTPRRLMYGVIAGAIVVGLDQFRYAHGRKFHLRQAVLGDDLSFLDLQVLSLYPERLKP